MTTHTRPPIVVSATDHEELIDLALKGLGRAPGATLLLKEMERASVVDATPPNVLAMNDGVDFVHNGHRYRDFRLVYPHCADFADGRLSVLTPIGAALIGVGEGQTMSWRDAHNDRHELTVLKVSRAAAR